MLPTTRRAVKTLTAVAVIPASLLLTGTAMAAIAAPAGPGSAQHHAAPRFAVRQILFGSPAWRAGPALPVQRQPAATQRRHRRHLDLPRPGADQRLGARHGRRARPAADLPGRVLGDV